MSKESSPAFQFYAAEYLADLNVEIMTPEEEFCYFRLMAFCWREEFLPNDADALSRLCKGVKPTLRVLSCFATDSQGNLRHPRLDKERKKQKEWITKSREAGYKSAAKRWGFKNKPGLTNLTKMVTPNGNQHGNQTVTLQSSSSISNNINPPTPFSGGNHLLFDIYKQKNQKLPTCMKLTADRFKKCNERCKDPEFQEAFSKAIIKAQTCDFLTGGNDRHWKADFDWLIKNDRNVYKVLEGKYSGLFDEEPQNE